MARAKRPIRGNLNAFVRDGAEGDDEADQVPLTGFSILAARRLLHWENRYLAKRASVRPETLRRAQSVAGEPPITIMQREKIRQALKAAGVEFTEGGVRLRPEALKGERS